MSRLILCMMMWVSLPCLHADTPNLLRCNARVSSGGQLFTGLGRWKAALIDGSGASLWSNDGTSVNGAAPTAFFTAQVLKGQASFMLGDAGMSALPATAFTQSGLKLRLWFQDGTHGFQQLTPDQTVQPVPMALVAAQADAPADGSITGASFASGAVGSAQLAGGSITTDKMGPGAVTGTKLASGIVAASGGFLPAGAVVLSDTEENALLTNAGFAKQGQLTSPDPVWMPQSPVFSPRDGHISTWTGTEMLLWGGDQLTEDANVAEGMVWKWNPSTGAWRAGTPVGAPIYDKPGQVSRSWYAVHVWTGSKWLIWNHSVGASYDPVADTWTPISTVGAPAGRKDAVAVWTGTEMIVWGGYLVDDWLLPRLNTGAAYNPVTNTWRQLSTVGAPAAASAGAAVWTGTEMIVWGGSLVSSSAGGRYNPVTDTWTAMSTVNDPSALYKDCAVVWTGTEMLIASGDPGASGSHGSIYNPTTDTWREMSTVNKPPTRADPVFGWTGTELILWGGYNYGEPTLCMDDGARYNPTTDTWTPMSTVNAPAARSSHAGVWTGSKLIVTGGKGAVNGTNNVKINDAFAYDPVTDSWTSVAMPTSPPSQRVNASSVWTGTEWIIFGGSLAYDVPQNGARYHPASGIWTPLPDGGPGLRSNSSVVWTGTELIVFGGYNLGYKDDVWRWNPTTNAWTATNPPVRPPARDKHTAVWTGTRMIIYAGRGSPTNLSDCWSYDPVADTWTSIPTHPSLLGTFGHSACWTGSKMIVYNLGSVYFAGIYDTATGAWTVPSSTNAINGPGVWTGTELIVWGGTASASNVGARLNPETNTWSTLSLVDTPAARFGHSLVWDGQHVIVWGGDLSYANDDARNDGGIFDPVHDTWAPLSSTGAPTARKNHLFTWTSDRMLIWGGETDPAINPNMGLEDLAELHVSTSRWFYVKN